VYPGGQIGNALAVPAGDPRSTVGVGSEATGSGGSADGTEIISARTVIGTTNPKMSAMEAIGTSILCMSVLSLGVITLHWSAAPAPCLKCASRIYNASTGSQRLRRGRLADGGRTDIQRRRRSDRPQPHGGARCENRVYRRARAV